MVWYSHLFKNFPQFVVIHTVKGFDIVNKAEIGVFLELSCFFDDPTNVSNLISVSSAFSKSSLNIWKFTIHVLLKLAWRILSIALLACDLQGSHLGEIGKAFFISLFQPYRRNVVYLNAQNVSNCAQVISLHPKFLTFQKLRDN